VTQDEHTILIGDNPESIEIAKNPVSHSRTQHITLFTTTFVRPYKMEWSIYVFVQPVRRYPIFSLKRCRRSASNNYVCQWAWN